MQTDQPRAKAAGMGVVKATLFGGVIFLLPLVLIAVILGKALGMAISLGQPVFGLLPRSAFWLALIPVLAILSLILIALMAGLFARTRQGQRLISWLETSIFGGVPQYQMMKSMAEGMARMESGSGWQPVLVPVQNGWEVGFVVEQVGNSWAAVFVPQAPSATVGQVIFLRSSLLKPLGVSTAAAASLVKNMGVGAGALLSGVDLDGRT